MDNVLWAPWRDAVIYRRKASRCIFCMKPKQRKDRENHLFMRRRYTFAMLNRYPYNNGHILVAPYRHVKSLTVLSPVELAALARHIRDCEALLKRILKPHGFNIGLNEGRIAGAGFENHVHIHVVPRWNGDTNFVPVLTRTKVISESLDALYRKIRHADAR